ncbi:hypothetical protein Gasu2_37310 [Galdieria sulphuraria]|uniref:Pectate lyase superfamily protein domain-containing protein n=1 Tax=Galdieria sulphuraria TaxID=130081 RepID=M2WTU2_GALSU|nr:uncharacterized protein Gasu_50610 [Galdieria sulphuraria]EME27330.1 hypothetical protein Gasu_50610 [Galdieria sulphuraria]GJD09482.1 hypothetical protein Gasu2_37310 [Galdieria sulphuraria]|eukprot:XP_005703850.1 hypothetical protein Gasu_50610 [Galdieria sulphuraria]
MKIVACFLAVLISCSLTVYGFPLLKYEGRSHMSDALNNKSFIVTVSALPSQGADFGPDTPHTKTSGIQEAIDYAASFLTNINMNPTSRKSLESNAPLIYLGPGSFEIHETIMLPEWGGISLVGSGMHSTVLKDATKDGIILIKQRIPKDVGIFYGQLNELLSDFSILGNPYQTSVAGIDLSMPENIPHNVVTRIALYGNFTEFHLCMDGNEDSLLDTLFIDGYSKNGTEPPIIGFSTDDGATFMRGIYSSNPSGGCRIHSRSVNLYITDSVIGAISNAAITKGQYEITFPNSVVYIKNTWFNIDTERTPYVFDLRTKTHYSTIALGDVWFENYPAGKCYFYVGNETLIEQIQLENLIFGYGEGTLIEGEGKIGSLEVGFVYSYYKIPSPYLEWYPGVLDHFYVAKRGVFPIYVRPPTTPPLPPSPPTAPGAPPKP